MLDFTDGLPDDTGTELNRDHWLAVGFTDDEIASGISILATRSREEGAITDRVFVSGLLSPEPGIRVMRQQRDGQFTDSALDAAEKSAIVRLAFLSQLVGYISDRYAAETPYRAVNAFITELESSRGLQGDMLRNMFHAHPLRGLPPQQLTPPTLVEDLTRFDELIGNYRQRLDPKQTGLHSGSTYEASRLVDSGEYFTRVITSLGLATDELAHDTSTPRAIA